MCRRLYQLSVSLSVCILCKRVCLSVFVYQIVSNCVSFCRFVPVSLFVYLCWILFVSICVYLCMFISTYASLSISMCLFLFVFFCVSVPNFLSLLSLSFHDFPVSLCCICVSFLLFKEQSSDSVRVCLSVFVYLI